MSEITIANKDWAVVAAVKAALAAATVDSTPVFESVTVTTSPAQAGQCQLVHSPAAVLRYVTTREDDSPEDVRGCRVVLELLLAVLADVVGTDESARLQEVLRLKNAAINAVETDPPADAHAWGDGSGYHPAIRWGPPEIDASTDRPWAVCRLPAEIGFVLDGPTTH
ncbi:MAG TPA: hypothetical protein VM695_06140 [Phycisphaerae bacterium]|nr:hypothetical protein [Phycisphaerae bacterium]